MLTSALSMAIGVSYRGVQCEQIAMIHSGNYFFTLAFHNSTQVEAWDKYGLGKIHMFHRYTSRNDTKSTATEKHLELLTPPNVEQL